MFRVLASLILVVLLSIFLFNYIDGITNPGVKIFESRQISVGKLSIKCNFIFPFNISRIYEQDIGSAFFFDPTHPIVVTNDHVVKILKTFSADKLHYLRIEYAFYFTDHTGKIYEAELISSREDLDMAFLLVKTRSWRAIPLGDPHKLRVGEKVYAIGSPLGIFNSFGTGIITGLNRHITFLNWDKKYEPMNLIQTDCHINPGNSGGPLLNKNGEAVGINTLSLNAFSDISGIYFAIPIDLMEPPK